MQKASDRELISLKNVYYFQDRKDTIEVFDELNRKYLMYAYRINSTLCSTYVLHYCTYVT